MRPGSPVSGSPIRQDEKIEHPEGPHLPGLLAATAACRGAEEPAGTSLTRASEPGTAFFLIMDGRARVEVSEQKQGRLGPGDFFGEMRLLDREPRSATVVAETGIRLLVIDRRNFWTLLVEVPRLTHGLLVTLPRRVRQAEHSPNA